ncbi:MAG: type II toxin-antitoxin system HicB family antitoxin [Moorea sp. SIO3C2]|nr:type II toxin-antitoxin system HicB family antitoxin [Moorena sp. SIO3C2]
MIFKIEVEQEEDGRWLAEIPELSGVMLYGQTLEEALTKVQALALRVIAERLESGEAQSDLVSVTFNAA